MKISASHPVQLRVSTFSSASLPDSPDSRQAEWMTSAGWIRVILCKWQSRSAASQLCSCLSQWRMVGSSCTQSFWAWPTVEWEAVVLWCLWNCWREMRGPLALASLRLWLASASQQDLPWVVSYMKPTARHRGNCALLFVFCFFCRAVTSILSQRLLHKMQCSFHSSCSRPVNPFTPKSD